MRTDLDAELVQQHLTHRAARDARYGFPGARALQDVTGVLAVVLERSGEIGVAGPWPGDLAAPLATGCVGFRSHHILPVLPVAVPHQHGDRGAEGLARAHAGEPFDLVCLDLHARAAAVAAHAPFQLGVDALGC